MAALVAIVAVVCITALAAIRLSRSSVPFRARSMYDNAPVYHSGAPPRSRQK